MASKKYLYIDDANGRLSEGSEDIVLRGEYGIGSNSTFPSPIVTDANAITSTGFYRLSNPFTNGPTAANYHIIHSQATSTANQIAIESISSPNPPRIFSRNYSSSWSTWEEVWTSRNLVKTASQTDNTTGAMLKVGDFGWGAGSSTLPAPGIVGADANTAVIGGMYRIHNTYLNIPSGAHIGAMLLVLAWDNNAAQQICTYLDRIWVRAGGSLSTTPIWGTWRECWTSIGNNQITSPSGSLGFGTGSGGTVTQATNKSTGVTLNKPTGQITMNAASLAANTSVSFLVTNSACAATDIPVLAIQTGATNGAYTLTVETIAAGSFMVQLRNNTAGALAEAVVLNFAIIKGATA